MTANTNRASDPAIDRVIAGDTWEFNADVAACFDQMLQRSVPGYATMRQAVEDLLASYFSPVTNNTLRAVDLGSSRGASIDSLLRALPGISVTGVECAPAMVDVLIEKYGNNQRVQVLEHNLRSGLPADVRTSGFGYDVVSCVLTLMFVPVELRPSLLEQMRAAITHGGILVLVEKTQSTDWGDDRLMTEAYYAMKRRHLYTDDEIEAKRLSLQNVLVPLPADTIEQMLRSAGFRPVPFFRCFNFCGWLGIPV